MVPLSRALAAGPTQQAADDPADPLVRVHRAHPHAAHGLGGKHAGGFADDPRDVERLHDITGDAEDIDPVDHCGDIDPRRQGIRP